jgi:uncharacterized membrane protein
VELLFKHWTVLLAAGIEASAGIVIGLTCIQAVLQAVLVFFERRASAGAKEEIRLQLGRWLALALEFELAADILRTAVAPTWNEIGQLAAIVILRTVLNYFLQKEIDQVATRNIAKPTSEASVTRNEHSAA